MKVFISWSGDRSKKIAEFLHEWLPTVLQNIKPYMSAESIDKGERWSLDIANQLQETNYGIVCVTPDNFNAPWILFESGALSKSINNSRVSPIIFDLLPSDLSKSPLLQFQLTQFNETEMAKLIISINNSAPDTEKVEQAVASKAFQRAWNELESFVSTVSSASNVTRSIKGDSIEQLSALGQFENAIEEILSNTRSQIKILNSPAEILPKEYLLKVLEDVKLEGEFLPIEHPAWKDVQNGVVALDEFVSFLDENHDKDWFLISSEIQNAKEVLRRARRGVAYVIDRLYRREYGEFKRSPKSNIS